MGAGLDFAAEFVGLDVGGSSVKAGRIRGDGTVLAERSAELPRERGAPGQEAALQVAILVDVARSLGARGALGVGLPGLLNRERGRIEASPNLPWLNELGLRELLAQALGIEPGKVKLENDANAAALGELWQGAGRGLRHALLVTLGTGIGGGLILGGELFQGAGFAGEIGHVNLVPEGLACGCGGRGCLEQYASATAARRRALEAGLPAADPGNLELLAERARAAAGPERRLCTALGLDLGRGLAAAAVLLDLEAFVFGGGFSAALDVLEPGIRQGLVERAYGERSRRIQLKRAALGPSAGWIGAARLAF